VVNIEILVGSTLGATEYVAEATQPFIEDAGFTSQIHFKPELTNLNIINKQVWLICLATHGAGDYPENFNLLVEQIKSSKDSFSNVQFGLIGVGDSNYDTFCYAAKNLDLLLLEKGATRIGSVFNIDVVESPIPEDSIEEWIPQWLQDLKNSLK